MTIPKNQLSSLVPSQLPEFVRIDHPTLVAFLSAYYEWLETNSELYSPMALEGLSDVDETMDKFVSQFKKQYLLDFPEELAIAEDGSPVDVRKLVKNIKQFYRAKGTEKTYQFLFRILYDTTVEFYYPKKDILRLSDGKWIQRNSIRTTNTLGPRLLEINGFRAYQRNATGTIVGSAQVSTVNILQIGSYDIAEIFLTGINGVFDSDKQVEFFNGRETIVEASILPVVGQVNITNGGSNYKVGDKVVFTSAEGDPGRGAYGIVSAVSSTGAVTKIKIENFGVNYRTAPSVSITSSRGSGFAGACVPTGVCAYEGYYANNDGRLSTNKVMQDNRVYQNYSYVLQTEITIDRYRDIVRRLIHPAGLGFFGQVSIKRCARADLDHHNQLIKYDIPLIGNYAPYTFNTFDDLSAWFIQNGVQVGYDPDVHDTVIIDQASGNPISEEIDFIPGTDLLSTPNTNGDPFWIVFQHPNRLIEGTVTARIWQNEKTDFLTTDQDEIGNSIPWHEWTLPIDLRQEWVGFTGDYQYANLRYDNDSSFRKIVTDAFFKIRVGRVFDCRSERVEVPALPAITISIKGKNVSPAGSSIVSNGTITFTTAIRNAINLEWYTSRTVRYTVTKQGSTPVTYDYTLTSPSATITGFAGAFYTVKADILDLYGNVVASSNVLSFEHLFNSSSSAAGGDTNA